MKKRLAILMASLALTATFGAFASCGGGENASTGGGTSSPITSSVDSSASSSEVGSGEAQEITGVSFSNASYVYDGTQRTLTITGNLPQGVSVAYENNVAINAGEYNATAVLSGENYITKTLTATLTIEKATITGITFTDKEFVQNGKDHVIEIEGELPTGVSVSYEQNKGNASGSYNATATLSGDNYHTLVLTAVMKIESFAKFFMDSLGTTPNAWEFFPESFASASFAIESIPDYTNFYQVQNIPKNGMGKQLNMVYGALTTLTSASGYVNTVYNVSNAIVATYEAFLADDPDNIDKTFSGAVLDGALGFELEVKAKEYQLRANVSGVNVMLYSNIESGEYGARLQLTNTTVLKYHVGENSLQIGITVLDVSSIYMELLRGDEDKVLGYVYEYLGTETVYLATSALIEVGEEYTTLIGTKGDFIPTAESRNCEVYRNSDAAFIGSEVREKVEVFGLVDTYNTLWYPLSRLQGVDSIKKVDEMNGTNADTIYINGSSDTLHSKTVGGLSKKSLSRRFDIEFKTMYFYQYDTAKEKYVSVTAEIPMLFIQEEQMSTFVEDFQKENKTALAGNSVILNVSVSEKAAVNYGYYTLLQAYDVILDSITYQDIKEFCS